MSDNEAEASVNRELQQLQQANEKSRKKDAKAQEEQISIILGQLLTHEARERLNRIGLVRSDLAKTVTKKILSLYQAGRISARISDSELIALLDKTQSTASALPTITIKRKGEDDYTIGNSRVRPKEVSDSESDNFDTDEDDESYESENE